MLNMIKADFYRMVRSRAIYIAVILMLFMLAMDIYTVESGSIYLSLSVNTGEQAEMSSEPTQTDGRQPSTLNIADYRKMRLKELTGYSLDKEILACNMNLYYFFIFVAAVAVAADLSGSCAKNTLASVISRKKYFLSKLLFVMLGCVMLCFLNTCCMYFGNLLFNGRNLASDFGSILRITLLQLPPLLALAGILTGFAFLFKRMSIFLAVVIPFAMIAQTALNFLRLLLQLPADAMNYELQTMIARLAMDPSPAYILQSYAVCVGVILLFGALGWFSFRKAEIR